MSNFTTHLLAGLGIAVMVLVSGCLESEKQQIKEVLGECNVYDGGVKIEETLYKCGVYKDEYNDFLFLVECQYEIVTKEEDEQVKCPNNLSLCRVRTITQNKTIFRNKPLVLKITNQLQKKGHSLGISGYEHHTKTFYSTNKYENATFYLYDKKCGIWKASDKVYYIESANKIFGP